jgi:hypothetical protein
MRDGLWDNEDDWCFSVFFSRFGLPEPGWMGMGGVGDLFDRWSRQSPFFSLYILASEHARTWLLLLLLLLLR